MSSYSFQASLRANQDLDLGIDTRVLAADAVEDRAAAGRDEQDAPSDASKPVCH